MVRVTVNGNSYELNDGATYEELATKVADQYNGKIILADVCGKYRELSKTVVDGSDVKFVDTLSKAGFKVARRTMLMIMLKAVDDLYGGNVKVKAEFTIGKGIYCTLRGDSTPDEKFCEDVKLKVKEIIDGNLPIEKKSYALADAMELFEKKGLTDKQQLFNFRRTSRINIYNIGEYYDYYYGDMAPSTGYGLAFDIYLYDEGFVLLLPDRKNPEMPLEKTDSPKVFKAMKEMDTRGKELSVETVGALNEEICRGGFERIRLVTEAIQEGKISEIAADVASRDDVKFVMIAGPSSSGKTTFSYRLSTQLMAHGLKPHPIGLDNYYVDREFCPKDEDGNYDFECLEALDVEGFNNDMQRLLSGETVEIPTFNFKSGKREYNGNFITLGENDILVIEGIHGLNAKMSYTLPAESKYKVYISALTCLNIDEHNRIPTTDVRLLRRMVRDNRTRGTKASGTLAMWDSVRKGEEKHIFPFQESADAVFNSALIYELAVLKQFAEPLLFGIDKDDPGYHEAKRLLKFLDYFLGVTSEAVPNNSIMREFIGGSVFNV